MANQNPDDFFEVGADPGQSPESLWGLDWRQSSFLWTLYQKPLDQIIKEDYVDMGGIQRPGFSRGRSVRHIPRRDAEQP